MHLPLWERGIKGDLKFTGSWSVFVSWAIVLWEDLYGWLRIERRDANERVDRPIEKGDVAT
jgi:hypothetical protein